MSKQFNGERIAFLINGTMTAEYPYVWMCLDSFTSYTKLTQNRSVMSPKNCNLEENMGANLHDLRLGSGFLAMSPKSTTRKKNRLTWFHKN